tara:strand:- start:2796 stop:3206 length:411 start_codon:yes stop_codon:yes gene_type:complete
MSVNECPICYEEMDESNSIITDCNHKYHKDCLQTWAKDHNSCPICRKKLIDSYIIDEGTFFESDSIYEVNFETFLQQLEDAENDLRQLHNDYILRRFINECIENQRRKEYVRKQRRLRIRKYIRTHTKIRIHENIW